MKIVWMLPRGGYVTEPRSVTLWGTICWGIRYLFGNDALTAFLQKHEDGAPNFVISSAFPFKKWKGERLPFFPNFRRFTPEADPNEDVAEALKKYRLGKKLNKIEWLSQPDFEKMLRGEITERDRLATLLDEFEQKKEHLNLRKLGKVRGDYRSKNVDALKNTPPARHDHSITHNTIDRLRGGTLSLPDTEEELSGQLFHVEDIWWADPHDESTDAETGLFFLVEGTDEQIHGLLAPVLRFLEHWGIGADRTAGKGFFKFEIEDFTLIEPSDEASNALVNLALFIPKDKNQLAEIQNTTDTMPYRLENREGKGWSATGGFEKAPALFFAEGSVFPKLSDGLGRWSGRVRPNTSYHGNTVYDNGFGFMLNLNWKNP